MKHNIKNEQLDSLGPIWTMVQDQQGFMWFGGEKGLARYDGYNFKVYRFDSGDPRSIGGNYIGDIVVDRSGQLWIATNNGINQYHPKTDDFSRHLYDTSQQDDYKNEAHSSILEDRKGQLWVASHDGVLS